MARVGVGQNEQGTANTATNLGFQQLRSTNNPSEKKKHHPVRKYFTTREKCEALTINAWFALVKFKPTPPAFSEINNTIGLGLPSAPFGSLKVLMAAWRFFKSIVPSNRAYDSDSRVRAVWIMSRKVVNWEKTTARK